MHSFQVVPSLFIQTAFTGTLLAHVLTGVVITCSPCLSWLFYLCHCSIRKHLTLCPFLSLQTSPPLPSFWVSKCSRAQPWNFPYILSNDMRAPYLLLKTCLNCLSNMFITPDISYIYQIALLEKISQPVLPVHGHFSLLLSSFLFVS